MENRIDTKTEKLFLSYVSHRIRTPLNSVIGFSRLLLNRDLEEDKARAFAERILDSGYEILHYFQNIMDLSEIESGMTTVNAGQFDLNQSLSSTIEEFSERFQNERDINISFTKFENNKHIQVNTDEFLFKRIVGNIIELIQLIITEGNINISPVKTDEGYVKIYIRGASLRKINPYDQSFIMHDPKDEEDTDNVEYLTYKTTRKLSQLIGGSFQLEKKQEYGILFTLVIPLQN